MGAARRAKARTTESALKRRVRGTLSSISPSSVISQRW